MKYSFELFLLTTDATKRMLVRRDITADQAVGLMGSILTMPVDTDPPPATGEPVGKRKYKKRAPQETSEVDRSIDEFHKKRGIGETKTQLVEQALAAGISAATIATQVAVSLPTVYVIKKRMTDEGKLT